MDCQESILSQRVCRILASYYLIEITPDQAVENAYYLADYDGIELVEAMEKWIARLMQPVLNSRRQR